MTAAPVRRPVVAGRFYEGTRTALTCAAEHYLEGFTPPKDLAALLGGVVPHAGWVFSGPTAAKVFRTLSEQADPEVYVLLGAVHQWGVEQAAVYPAGAWSTPLGEIAVDADLAQAILDAGKGHVAASARAHDGEHSIEVQTPFIQVVSPSARIVPVATPPDANAVRVGEAVAQAVRADGRRIVVVASTDLTHYGMGYGVPDHGAFPDAMPWMHENDHRFIRRVERLEAEALCAEAAEHHNACGAGAVAAAVAACRALGAVRGRVIEYTTSAEVMHETRADRAVGYVGIVFEKPAGDAARRKETS